MKPHNGSNHATGWNAASESSATPVEATGTEVSGTSSAPDGASLTQQQFVIGWVQQDPQSLPASIA